MKSIPIPSFLNCQASMLVFGVTGNIITQKSDCPKNSRPVNYASTCRNLTQRASVTFMSKFGETQLLVILACTATLTDTDEFSTREFLLRNY